MKQAIKIIKLRAWFHGEVQPADKLLLHQLQPFAQFLLERPLPRMQLIAHFVLTGLRFSSYSNNVTRKPEDKQNWFAVRNHSDFYSKKMAWKEKGTCQLQWNMLNQKLCKAIQHKKWLLFDLQSFREATVCRCLPCNKKHTPISNKSMLTSSKTLLFSVNFSPG